MTGGWLHRLLLKSEYVLGCYPAVYPYTVAFRDLCTGGRRSAALIRKDTEIVIEGYPRSANSFAVAAFKAAQPRPVKVAHHCHAPSQVIRGVSAGKPVLVLIREPEAAIASFLVMHAYSTVQDAVAYYVKFYETIEPYLDGFLVASFDSVVHRYDRVIGAVNRKFGTEFLMFEPTSESVNACLQTMQHHSRNRLGCDTYLTHVPVPCAERDELKNKALEAVRENSKAADLLAHAKRIYRDYICSTKADESRSVKGAPF
jgi:hypothetical protein